MKLLYKGVADKKVEDVTRNYMLFESKIGIFKQIPFFAFP